MMNRYNSGKFILKKENKQNVFYRKIKEYLSDVSIARQVLNRELPEFIKNTNGSIYDIGGYSRELQSLVNNGQYLLIDIVDSGNIDILMDAEDMHFSDNTIDNFVCISVLEHTNNPEKIIDEIFRCLKKGGLFYFSVPFLFETHMEPCDFKRFTDFYLKNIFEKFRIIETTYVNGYFGLIAHFLQKVNLLKYTIGLFFYILELIYNKKTHKFTTQINYVLQKKTD